MTRHQRYSYTASPHRPSSHNTTALKLFSHSPVTSKAQLANRSRLQTRTTNTNRFLKSRTRLTAIKEEHEDDERQQARELYRQLNAYRDGSEVCQPEDEDDDMDWDETTLVAMLQDQSFDEQERDGIATVEQLKVAMSSRGPALKEYLANTIIPTALQLKEVHTVLDDEVDITFGKGLLDFDQVCKSIEALALQDEDDTKAFFLDVKKNVDNILGRLKTAESDRAQLWTNFEESIKEHTDRVRKLLDSVPEHLEQTISYLEKRSKELDKDDGSLEKLQTMILQKGLR